MSHKTTSLILLTAILAAPFVIFGAEPETNSPPNILFLYTDDQAPWGIGADGNEQIHTPNLDRLAQQGALLTNSFVTTPVCSPARAALMTSRYASEYGIWDFIPHPGHKIFDPEHQVGLDPASVTFPEVLQQAGYATGLIGKWHLGDWTQAEENTYHPTRHGYDEFMGLTGGGTSTADPPLEIDGAVRNFKGLTTDILTDHALDFLKRHQKEKFLLCVHFRAPHGSWLPVADEDWEPYEKLDPAIPNPDYPDLNVGRVKRMMREYMASISGVDRNVGRLLKALDEFKLTENTVVIFTSDHGYNMGHNGIYHKGNGIWVTHSKPPATKNIASKYRPNLYDNSLRVPAIVKWPGEVQPGASIDDTTTSLDWYPTLVEMAGAELPKNHLVRGRSLVPLLKGHTPADWDQDFYGEYFMINYCRADMRTYRTPHWKLVKDFLNPQRDEFYDLQRDPEEANNLIDTQDPKLQAIITKLTAKLLAKMTELDDPSLKRAKTE